MNISRISREISAGMDHREGRKLGQCREIPGRVVVTRHPALVELLKELELIDGDIRVIAHAEVDDVRGKVVYGVLPLHLAVHAYKIVELPLALTPEMRGKELDLETLRRIAGLPHIYEVKEAFGIS